LDLILFSLDLSYTFYKKGRMDGLYLQNNQLKEVWSMCVFSRILVLAIFALLPVSFANQCPGTLSVRSDANQYSWESPAFAMLVPPPFGKRGPWFWPNAQVEFSHNGSGTW
jgi:hypothetical protein